MAIASLPQIFISPAPPQEPAVEIYSPITFEITAPAEQDEDLQLRAKHLTPPPTNAHFSRPLSPLSPLRGDAPAKGLEIERFQAMLKATRDRGTVSGAVKRPAGSDLRKEIALKAHKNKQVERRALFLSKVLAPPSPTATSTPKTPPESPAIFHYTLPSPGLVSPLALFESLHEETPSFTSPATCKPWVEQVDFKLKRTDGTPVVLKQSSTPRSSTLPSLEQISARINYLRPIKSSGARLPAFLAKPRQPVPENRPPRLTTAVGRLQMPVRAPKPKPEPLDMLPPRSPMSPLTPKLQITTLVVPKSSRPSPTDLSEANVKSLESRERKAKTMLSALQRRLVPSLNGVSGYEDEEDRKSRRHSAPADLGPCGPRFGFAHPVLSLPGGF